MCRSHTFQCQVICQAKAVIAKKANTFDFAEADIRAMAKEAGQAKTLLRNMIKSAKDHHKNK